MKLLIMTVLFYYGSCEDTVTVREPPALPTTRVVGGRPTTVETYPYIAYLRSFYTMRDQKQRLVAGGGVILTQHHVLTAAHCLNRKINDTTAVTGTSILRASKVVIRVGSTYNDRGGSEYVTSKFVAHESYNHSFSFDNDVAVLVLPTSMSNYRSSLVQPAVIPPGGYVVPDNAPVVAVGWGLTDMNCTKSMPLGLRHVGLRKVDRDTCAARHPSSFSYDNMLCAGRLGVGGAGTCMGDSGGPLVYNGVVVGVTSFGMTCGDSFYPHVFTRVSSYSAWINNTVQQNQVQRKRRHNSAAAADVNFSLVLLASIWIIYSKIIFFLLSTHR